MRRRGRRLNRKAKILTFLVLLLVLAVLSFIYYNARLAPLIEAIGMSDAQDIATAAINNAIKETLKDPDIDYSRLTVVEKTSDGLISSIRTNPDQINKLTTQITLELLDGLSELDETYIKIPIGTLFDSEYFAGRGPSISIELCPTQSVFTDISTRFEAVGINQTIHSDLLTVTVGIDLVFPTRLVSAECSETVVIAETIIVGPIPDFYAATGAMKQK